MIVHADPLDLLRPATGDCLGAVFFSYAIDERFFESVLATLLPIHADPDHDPERFLVEGRRRLRETPVVVMVDSHQYRGGHRLPYSLVLADWRVAFFPRLSLLLFEDHARLMVGSGNLTHGGYGGNAELFEWLELAYDQDAALLAEVSAFIAGCRPNCEAWGRLQTQLDLLLRKPRKRAASTVELLYTRKSESVLEQFLAAIPKRARVQSVGLMTPIQPEDNAKPITSAYRSLIEWARSRARKDLRFEIGLSWADNTVSAPADAEPTPPETLVGRLCARIEGGAGQERLSWLIPEESVEDRLVCRVGSRYAELPFEALRAEMASVPPRLWPIDRVVGIGPMAALDFAMDEVDIGWWLFPELRLSQGKVFRRLLHAQLLTVCTVEGRRKRTYALVGGAPFQRHLAGEKTTIEVALRRVHDGHRGLRDLCPELIAAPDDELYLNGRDLPAPILDPEPACQRATYDAQTRALRLEWKMGVHDAAVTYARQEGEERLLQGRPGIHSLIADFELDADCAELQVEAGRQQWYVPIQIENIAHLRADEPTRDLPFAQLIAHLSGRFLSESDGEEEAAGGSSEEAESDSHGEAPVQEVFRALFALVDEVGESGASLGRFDVALRGPLGVRSLAERMLPTAGAGAPRPNEAWLYGQELLRMLSQLTFAHDAVGRFKQEQLEAFVGDLRAELARLEPKPEWLELLQRFYEVAP